MPRQPEQRAASARRMFDGVICFGGEDWWYHNRGHYDIQMMRELSVHVPVLYVNSIAMRIPSLREGAMFFRRVRRKLASLRRGFVRVDERFGVLSPIAIPGKGGLAVTRGLLTLGIVGAAQAMNISRPLVWVACPTAADVIDALQWTGLVYQRTDRYECFPGVDQGRIDACDDRLKGRADLTVFCADLLFERESDECRRACLIDHGVDFERFAQAGSRKDAEPDDLAAVPRPRVGFVGGIDAHTFDASLFLRVARQLSDVQFILVGACSLPAGWCQLPNVTLLGQRPHEQVADYMSANDVLIMPWRRNRWIESCNPVKLKEYLAVGRPIVSTDFNQLRRYHGVVRVASGSRSFANEVQQALSDPGDTEVRRAQVAGQTWTAAAKELLDHLATEGLVIPERSALPEYRGAVDEPPSTAPDLDLPGRNCHIQAGGCPAVRACIVLAGGLRPSRLVEAAGRSVLDLYLTPGQTVLDIWIDRLSLLPSVDGQPVPIRVVHNAHVPAPWPVAGATNVRIEHDPLAYRGPAGVVADLCAGYDDHEQVLITDASRVPACDLASMVVEHLRTNADITVACNPDESPGGLYITRCRALRMISPIGFVDIKEQWLARATAAGLYVRVHCLSTPGALPLRTRTDFLVAARYANWQYCVGEGSSAALRRTGIDNYPYLRVVGRGAAVASNARIHNSVIMPGAVVGRGALIVRSVVCSSALIEPGSYVAEAVVSASGCHVDRDSARASIDTSFYEQTSHLKAA